MTQILVPLRRTFHPTVAPLRASPRITAPLADAAVWSRTTSEPNYKFSNDQLSADTSLAGSGGDRLLRGATSASTGYFEVLVVASGGGMAIGLTSSSQPTSDWVGDINGNGYAASGNVLRGGSVIATYSSYTAGDIIGVCRKGNFLYLSKNGVWQNSADPSAGTGGIDVSAYASDVLFPAASANNNALSVKGRFSAGDLTYAIPTGVTAWDGTTTSTVSNDISGTSSLTFTPSSTLTGTGTLSGSSALAFAASGTATGKGQITGSSTLTFVGSGAMTGLGSVAGSSSLLFSPSGTATGLGRLIGSSSLTFAPSATATGLGALIGASTLVFTPSGTTTGLGSLTGSSALAFAALGTTTGIGTLAGSSSLGFASSASLTGIGSLLASTALSFSLSGAIGTGGSNDIAGSAALTFASSAALSGLGQMLGSATFSLTLSGSIIAGGGGFVVTPKPANANLTSASDPSETNVIGPARPAKVPITTVSTASGAWVPAVKPARGQWRT